MSPAQALSPATVRAYAADWALFTDWCEVTGEWELPADPDTVLFFLTDCPAAPATQRRRVAAIDHHHTTAGYPRPGESPRCGPRSAARSGKTLRQPDIIGAGRGRTARVCRRTGGRAGCSAGATGAYWCCPNWLGCRTNTWPP